ncbi:transcriptional regulator [Streptomonospora nanhaiensis]|uniref:transcriptional regulator n=1 Tax=Streptomonospora nanhaiensis TaxID=1323731 RepID=UPI001C990853|nr:transcriptional regulator [Streptomonospora nanhaiensis]MBX9391455.1 transcriptional regulator [Streptomonospora nanhaiensis]
MNLPSPPPPTADDLLVLHALRCVGHSAVARLAAATGLDEAAVESALIDLGVDGLVTRSAGPWPAWGLTEAGRAADARRITGELEAAGARPAVHAAYERFMVLNPELLDLCTAWQLRTVDGAAAVNDHADPDYDARVLDRFAGLHGRAEAVLADLAAALPRFGRYRTRLSFALDRARAGDPGYVADDLASYHTVWAELHEDLLATLGIPR